MLRSGPFACVFLACLGVFQLQAVGADGPSDVVKVIVPFVEKHCVQCHGEKKPKGDVSLDVFKDEASIVKARKTWMRVLEQLHSGEMPPQGKPKPTVDEAERFVQAVRAVFDRFDRAAKPDPGRVTMRRLSRTEYVNTIRDLVGVNVT
ncbi:MAG: c-type cytochrome domain-containing protein, partial [Planctomycetota bacterium]